MRLNGLQGEASRARPDRARGGPCQGQAVAAKQGFTLVEVLVALVVVAVGMLGVAVLQDIRTRPLMEEANDAALRSYGFTDQALKNNEVVRAMGLTEPLAKRWRVFRQTTMDRSSLASDDASFMTNISRALRQGIQVVIIAVGAWLVVTGRIHAGLLFANMILGARALQPIDRLVGSWDSLMNGARAFERLTTVFEGYQEPRPSTALPLPLPLSL